VTQDDPSEVSARHSINLDAICAHLDAVGISVTLNDHGHVPTSLTVSGATHDSRLVTSGSIFCCVPGDRNDGHDFAQIAVEAGAVALLVQRPIHTQPEVPQLLVSDVRSVLGHVAAAAYGHPSRKLVMIGITGTNGKTSTAHMLADILIAAGHRTEVIGTLTQTRTTPESTDLHQRLASFVDGGVTHVVMEVTSHALFLHRVVGVHFALAVFTNLSQDHLDFHENMEAYFRAKAMLFTPSFASEAVVNADDPRGHLLFDAASIPTTMFSFEQAEQLQAGVVSTFLLRGVPVTLRVGGRFSVANALAAAQAAHTLGINDTDIALGLAQTQVPGRFETIRAGQAFGVIVDYAHTPDGLERVLDSARAITSPNGRLISVFGCGGDRDKTKRPLMGAVSARLSDLSIVTSDNPRSEDPQAIISDILAGASGAARESLRVETDRRIAIQMALREAASGDVVVIAGKGHEQGQDVGGVISPFDDRVIARETLAELAKKP
jgi:UDP-N-acetylmuramoyl-L-alanyl-D-glutamate--2,6-diaminopimelate ligase